MGICSSPADYDGSREEKSGGVFVLPENMKLTNHTIVYASTLKAVKTHFEDEDHLRYVQ